VSQRNQLRRIEDLEDGQGPCPGCGSDPNAKIVYKIVWPEDEPEDVAPLQSSQPCPWCGEQRVIALDWEDIGEGMGGGE
jgi:hypothetical protein